MEGAGNLNREGRTRGHSREQDLSMLFLAGCVRTCLTKGVDMPG